ncbi:hypothetical protein TNCV_2416831 [Trichonephila clavipes]|nr:hypothetical protein TNCV_2416831 [Trichonephila clavipes]
MSRKRETKWFLITKASLIWHSKKTRLSRVDRPLRIRLCRGEISFPFSKTYTKRERESIYYAFKGLAEAARQSNGTVPQRICCHLARLQDWNHNGFSPAGGKPMLLPNSVE